MVPSLEDSPPESLDLNSRVGSLEKVHSVSKGYHASSPFQAHCRIREQGEGQVGLDVRQSDKLRRICRDNKSHVRQASCRKGPRVPSTHSRVVVGEWMRVAIGNGAPGRTRTCDRRIMSPLL